MKLPEREEKLNDLCTLKTCIALKENGTCQGNECEKCELYTTTERKISILEHAIQTIQKYNELSDILKGMVEHDKI